MSQVFPACHDHESTPAWRGSLINDDDDSASSSGRCSTHGSAALLGAPDPTTLVGVFWSSPE